MIRVVGLHACQASALCQRKQTKGKRHREADLDSGLDDHYWPLSQQVQGNVADSMHCESATVSKDAAYLVRSRTGFHWIGHAGWNVAG